MIIALASSEPGQSPFLDDIPETWLPSGNQQRTLKEGIKTMTLLPNRALSLLTLIALLAVITLASAQEEEDRIAFSFGADIASKYVWRGQVLNDEAVLQPTVDLSVNALGGTVGFNWWAVMDMTDINGEVDQLTENDWTISYTTSLGPVELSAGYIYYYFPQITGESDTTEVYVGVSIPIISKEKFSLGASVTAYYDIENVRGYYGNIGFEAGVPLSDKWNLSLSAAVGIADDNYNEVYFGVKNDGFNDLTASVGLSCAIDDHSELSLSLTWNDVLDGDLEEAAESSDGYGETNVWFFMAGLSYSF
jgi:uncharacterized protein (TIGR02001 family)